jgi:hypothetical protein
MREFRLYVIDATGHISSVSEIVATETVEDALAEARAKAHRHPVELWEGAHMIVRIDESSADARTH